MGRTNIEQRIKTGIHEKNRISRKLRRRLREIEEYRRSSASRKGHWKKRYAASADRLEEEARKLARDVIARGETLQKKMQDELKFSEGEVKAFEEKFEKERAEHRAAMEKAGKAMEFYEHEAAQQALRGTTKEDAGKLQALEDEAYKARSKARKEAEDVRKALKEISSEAKDKAFFTLELERIAAERAALKGLA